MRLRDTIEYLKESAGIEHQLQAMHPKVQFSLSKAPWGITLNMIRSSEGGEGNAAAFMEDLISIADREGLPIFLTPSSDFGASVPRLKRFYKRFGFVDNKGKNRDFSSMEDMVRPPKND